ncbi:hypothetical protein LO771_06335 [Streptacidiphilus sp. ASG 303]|uniref:hypothetical protein n=1 Tax=Streptacidiphilus sp. ASG 303 TaxID=2896847 RepID=UPI001E53E24C|nr:hypothetical protein [Streptacidiphilus sp. ASG 303]MCD0482043.1 hypothetical protein [Streptacidiphilus sp. ASG 303]
MDTAPAPRTPADSVYRPHPLPGPVALRQDTDRVILPAALAPEHLALLLAPATPTPAPVDTRLSGRAKDAALVAVSGGLGVGAATAGVGYGAGMIASASEGLMTASLALALGSASVTGLVLFLRTAFGRSHSGGGADGQAGPHITQNITATGLFGRAHGTITRR